MGDRTSANDQFCKIDVYTFSGAAAHWSQTATCRLVEQMKIYEIKNKGVALLRRAACIARIYGHPYKRGMMVGKNFIALAIRQLCGYNNDEKFADFLQETGIAEALGYKRRPNSSLFSKTRRYAEDGAITALYNELAKEECRGRVLRLIGEDSTDMPAFYTEKDPDARLGHRTQKKREQQLNEMTGKDKREKAWVFGYKLHLIQDCETGLPLTGIVLPANVHDSQPFYELFPYVEENFAIQCDAKFLGDSAYDSASIRNMIRDRRMKDVIAVNGRGHYDSEKPKDEDYGKRWSLEQRNSVLEMVYNLPTSRMKGIKRTIVHAFSCLLANFMEHFMD